MKIDKQINWLKSRKIEVLVLICIILISSMYFINRNSTKVLRLLKDTFVVEYGNPIPTNSKEYLDMSRMEKSIKEDIDKVAKLSVDKKGQKEYLDIGKYTATIIYQKEQVRFSIVVQDTTPPSFATMEDVIVPVGTILTSQQIKDRFVVTDLQSVKVEVEEGGYDANKPGKYMIKATARDASGNMATASYFIIVEKKENSVDGSNGISISSNKKEESLDNNTLNKQVEWWDSLSNQEISEKVVASLVWKNEWTNAIYYGLKGVTFGFNVEDKAYGGLTLLKNPYNVQLDFGFYGGPYCQTYTNTFSLYWQAPSGPGREVNCGTVKVNIPKAITSEELYNHYQ